MCVHVCIPQLSKSFASHTCFQIAIVRIPFCYFLAVQAFYFIPMVTIFWDVFCELNFAFILHKVSSLKVHRTIFGLFKPFRNLHISIISSNSNKLQPIKYLLYEGKLTAPSPLGECPCQQFEDNRMPLACVPCNLWCFLFVSDI